MSQITKARFLFFYVTEMGFHINKEEAWLNRNFGAVVALMVRELE